jgi:hypothetical protein
MGLVGGLPRRGVWRDERGHVQPLCENRTERPFAGAVFRSTRPICQDRLGTNTREKLKKNVFFSADAITADPDHLIMADYFYKAEFMDPLAASQDALNFAHANTHLPQVIGKE